MLVLRKALSNASHPVWSELLPRRWALPPFVDENLIIVRQLAQIHVLTRADQTAVHDMWNGHCWVKFLAGAKSYKRWGIHPQALELSLEAWERLHADYEVAKAKKKKQHE